jgi:hypothetical protein
VYKAGLGNLMIIAIFFSLNPSSKVLVYKKRVSFSSSALAGIDPSG